jgi:pimeloyl-ACP methyl ester carboxylesterase
MRASHLFLAAVTFIAPLDCQAQTGAFRVLQGGREIANEIYRWSGTTLEATADVGAVGRRLVARTVYDDRFEPVEYVLHVYQIATGEELQGVRASFGADSVSWVTSGQNASAGSRPIARPRAVMQNLLFSHVDAMVRRPAIRAGGQETVHTFLVDNAQVLDLALARAGSQATLTIAGTAITVAVTPEGSMDSATVPSQTLVVQRAPAESVSASRPLEHRAAAPPPAGIVEEQFTWVNSQQRLAGTMTRPAAATGPVPVVLIIAGSGPTDRDGNNAMGLRTDTYKKLAWDLAARGIASVRYDKRGLGGSSVLASSSPVTFDDFADDAVAGARALAADRRFSRVVLIGHSEGAGLATRAANRGAPVAGVVMMAGLGRPFRAVLHEQLAGRMDAAGVAEFERLMDAYLGDGPMPEIRTELRVLFPPSARRFVQTAVAIDPAGEARRLRVPLLVLQGATDIQVRVADAEALRAARPDADVRIIPAANHLFVPAERADAAAQAATYTDPTLPLVPELVPAVVGFVMRVAR